MSRPGTLGTSRIARDRKRFINPAGGSTSSASPSNMSVKEINSSVYGRASTSMAGSNVGSRVPSGRGGTTHVPPSRYLVTVLPPPCLPCDPPHPRTSTLCSGYGPPSKFRRGTLVPLYPTLAGQIAAIAREYELPSTGGIVVYLVDLSPDSLSGPSGEAFVGPRIGDEAWNLLWGQLFQDEAMLSEQEEDESIDALEMDTSAVHGDSVIRQIPQDSSGYFHHHSSESPAKPSIGGIRSHSPSERNSDASSLADSSSISVVTSEEAIHNNSIESPSSNRFPRLVNISANMHRMNSSSPSVRSQSSMAQRKRMRERHQLPDSDQFPRNHTSRASLSTNKSQSSKDFDGVAYGEAVIVGKLEFDIDRRRGAGRWFDAWLEIANPLPGVPSHGTTPASSLKSFPRKEISDTSVQTTLKIRKLSISEPSLENPAIIDERKGTSAFLSGLDENGQSVLSEGRSSARSEEGYQANGPERSALPTNQLLLPTPLDQTSTAEEHEDRNRPLVPAFSEEPSGLVAHDGASPSTVGESYELPRQRSLSRNTAESSAFDESQDPQNATPRTASSATFKPHGLTTTFLPDENGTSRSGQQFLSGYASLNDEGEGQVSHSWQTVSSDPSNPSPIYRSSSSSSSKTSNASLSLIAADDKVDRDDVNISQSAYQQLPDEEEDESFSTRNIDALSSDRENESEDLSASAAHHKKAGLSFESLQPQHDPLRDMFPGDAATWADIKSTPFSLNEELDDGELSPTEERVGGITNGLGILSPPPHGITASASSSLDPFEYDTDPAEAPTTIDQPEDDVREVMDLLHAHSLAKDVGLSSPISLEESSRHAFQTFEDSGSEPLVAKPQHQARADAPPYTRTSSQPTSLDKDQAALIALPESHSSRSVSTSSLSQSTKSVTSSALSSHPSISEPETLLVDPPRTLIRDGDIPSKWPSIFSPTQQSRMSSKTVDLSDRSISPSIPTPYDINDDQKPVLENSPKKESISQTSVAEFAAQIARSRSSSVEMMDNLDEIERALAELSPRSLKAAPPDGITPMPTFRSFFPAELPGNRDLSPTEENTGQLERASSAVTALGARTVGISDISPSQESNPLPELPVRAESLNGSQQDPLPSDMSPSYSQFPNNIDVGKAADYFAGPGPLSPDAMSVASTHLPYSFPSPVNTPPLQSPKQISFAALPEVIEDLQPTKVQTSKFSGLKLKGWSGKNSNGKEEKQKDRDIPQQLRSIPSPSSVSTEAIKSPRSGFKGLRFWQKDDQNTLHIDPIQRLAMDISLPLSPASSSQGDLPKPSFPRVPRKSSLASLKAHAPKRSETPSPHLAPLDGPFTPPLNMTNGMFPSPPTHTSLPSLSASRPAPFPSLASMNISAAEFSSESLLDTPPLLMRGYSSATQSSGASSGPSPQLVSHPMTSHVSSSLSMPSFGARTHKADDISAIDSTPSRNGTEPRFLGGYGQISSAPVTPAYAEPSIVPSSGRLGKPMKANPVKTVFRLSADADLTKMLSHMQAIEFGEDEPEKFASIREDPVESLT